METLERNLARLYHAEAYDIEEDLISSCLQSLEEVSNISLDTAMITNYCAMIERLITSIHPDDDELKAKIWSSLIKFAKKNNSENVDSTVQPIICQLVMTLIRESLHYLRPLNDESTLLFDIEQTQCDFSMIIYYFNRLCCVFVYWFPFHSKDIIILTLSILNTIIGYIQLLYENISHNSIDTTDDHRSFLTTYLSKLQSQYSKIKRVYEGHTKPEIKSSSHNIYQLLQTYSNNILTSHQYHPTDPSDASVPDHLDEPLYALFDECMRPCLRRPLELTGLVTWSLSEVGEWTYVASASSGRNTDSTDVLVGLVSICVTGLSGLVCGHSAGLLPLRDRYVFSVIRLIIVHVKRHMEAMRVSSAIAGIEALWVRPAYRLLLLS